MSPSGGMEHILSSQKQKIISVSLVGCVSIKPKISLALQHSRKDVHEILASNYLGLFAILMGT